MELDMASDLEWEAMLIKLNRMNLAQPEKAVLETNWNQPKCQE